MKEIQVSDDIYDMLKEIQFKNETMDDVIGKLLDEYYQDINEKKINSDTVDEFEEEEYEDDIIY